MSNQPLDPFLVELKELAVTIQAFIKEENLEAIRSALKKHQEETATTLEAIQNMKWPKKS